MAKKILIVDDDQAIHLQLVQALKDIAELDFSSAGHQAIAMAKDLKPDLILLDLGLPDIHGHEVLRILKSDPTLSTLPVMVITSYNSEQSEYNSLAGGAVLVINKPINNRLIREQVNNILSLNIGVKESRQSSNIDHQFSNVMGMLSEAVVLTDNCGNIELINQYCANLFGYHKDELIGQNVRIFTPESYRPTHDHNIEHYQQTGEQHLIGNPRELVAVTKSGHELHIHMNLSVFRENDREYFLAIIRDITEKRVNEAKLLRSALYDSLTGLNSLVALNMDLDNLASTELNEGYVFSTMIDIDDFQSLNIALGNRKCDEILKNIGEVLNIIAIETKCKAYRLMSDRFMVFGFCSSWDEAKAQKEKLVDAISSNIYEIPAVKQHFVSVAMVCLISCLESFETDDLKKQLEAILAAARKEGKKGEVIRASEGSYQLEAELAALRMSLQSEYDASLFSVVLQPKVRLNGEISSFEALLRWSNKDYGSLHLGHLISALEDTGTIIRVGYLVIEQVCQFIASIPKSQRKPVAINLSVRQLVEPDFLDKTLACSSHYGVEPEYLGFEITESMIAEDIELIANMLRLIRQAGFTIEIDDFGTGQSNLKYIHKLPIDGLKIDKSFIDDITDFTSDYPLVEGIYLLARAMSLNVVAEGVESQEQYRFLKKLGVDEIQGYLFFKPMSLKACQELLCNSTDLAAVE